jgi:hypothetical protein
VLTRGQLQLERGHDLLRELVLDGENVGEVAIEPAAPDMPPLLESINCAVTRTRLPALRTLPSST